ncbi:MAG: hypothetical protein ACOZAA_16510 [Pseudomonadota bacterium]
MNALRLAAALLLAASIASIAAMAPAFSAAAPAASRSIELFVLTLAAAGGAYLVLVPRLAAAPLARRTAAGAFALGLALRALFFTSTPILEDDWRRYLWEGAAIAAGVSPYDHPPAEGLASPFEDAAGGAEASDAKARLKALGAGEPDYPETVNHPYLATIYPPLAEAAFLTARLIAPFDLFAWRGVLFAADLSTFFILATALGRRGLPRSRAFLYWLNPLVIFETFNAAHMEALVCPFLGAAMLFAQEKRAGLAGAMLASAAGVKIWPILLAPILARSFTASPARFLRFCAVFSALAALFLAPLVLSLPDAASGLAAYASDWRRNAFLFPMVEFALSSFSGDPDGAARRAVALVTIALGFSSRAGKTTAPCSRPSARSSSLRRSSSSAPLSTPGMRSRSLRLRLLRRRRACCF